MEGMLSQDEIDALLAQAQKGTIDRPSENVLAPEIEVKLYDFKRPEKFSREQLRNLERIHERFARLLSTTLSAYIRTNINVKIESVTPLSYHEFVFSLPQPTLIHVIELEPLPGQAAIEMTPTVAFPMFERMMGGKQARASRPRQMSDVELQLFQRPFERIIHCLQETWQDFIRLRPRLLRVEQDPQFAQVAATNTPVVVVSLEVTIGDDFGLMSVCMPDVLVDALLQALGQDRVMADMQSVTTESESVQELLTTVTLPVYGELGQSRLTVEQVRALRTDDVVRFDTAPGEDISVYVGDMLLFRGQVCIHNRKLAIRIADRYHLPAPLEAALAADDDESEEG